MCHFPKRQILDSAILKEFADHNFEFDGNGRKLSKWVKTLREKEKLLVMINFSFSHSVFKRLALQTGKKQGLFEKGLTLYYTSLIVSDPEKETFDNVVGKGENAGNQYFLLFQQCFYSSQSKFQFLRQISFAVCKQYQTQLVYNFVLFNPSPNKPLFFTFLQYKSFENTVGKGEIARNEQFLLFPQCFLSILRAFCHFPQI